jgi:hypothetical protein
MVLVLLGVLAGMQAWVAALKLPSSTPAIVLQIFVALLGVAIGIYCFLLAIYEEDLDDFALKERERTQELVQKSRDTDSDGRGMKV